MKNLIYFNSVQELHNYAKSSSLYNHYTKQVENHLINFGIDTFLERLGYEALEPILDKYIISLNDLDIQVSLRGTPKFENIIFRVAYLNRARIAHGASIVSANDIELEILQALIECYKNEELGNLWKYLECFVTPDHTIIMHNDKLHFLDSDDMLHGLKDIGE